MVMKRIIYLLSSVSLLLACSNGTVCGNHSAALESDAVTEVVNAALGWQLDNMPDQGREWYNPKWNGWADGVLLGAAATWNHLPGLRERLRSIAEENKYEPAPKCFNPANGLAVSMLYTSLYLDDPQPRFLQDSISDFQKELGVLKGGWQMLTPTIERMDYLMKHWPQTDNLDFMVVANQEKWSWCDALYVAAPTFATIANITGCDEYREFMNREFWNTKEYLYSPSDSLIFRDSRFFTQEEPNGNKVFWGRGNGWVLAALARVMNLLPEDYPDIDKYESMFKEMASKLVRLQGQDGFWRASLLDPDSYPSPESSATGLISYGLWWGINKGLLDENIFLPAAKASWTALVSAVQPCGKLGWVQPIGDTPEHLSPEKNEVYGTAALVLAGGEILKYINSKTK
jgi:hypothetical protein